MKVKKKRAIRRDKYSKEKSCNGIRIKIQLRPHKYKIMCVSEDINVFPLIVFVSFSSSLVALYVKMLKFCYC